MHAALIEQTAATASFFERGKRASRRPRGVLSESLKERERGRLAVGQDIYSQSNFHYTNLAGSENPLPKGTGPLDPKTKISGYTLPNAGVT